MPLLSSYLDDTPFGVATAAYSSPVTWTYHASAVPEGITAGDVVVMVIFSGASSPWSMASAPGDWDLQFSDSFTEDGLYWNFFIYTKVWGAENPATYTASWVNDGTGLVLDTHMANHAVGAGGIVGSVGANHALTPGASAPASFPYPNSTTEFELLSGAHFFVPTTPVDLAWFSIGGDDIYFAATYDPDNAGSYIPPFYWDYTPTPLAAPLTSVTGSGAGGLRVYAAWVLAFTPDESVRISGNARRFRRLSVS